MSNEGLLGSPARNMIILLVTVAGWGGEPNKNPQLPSCGNGSIFVGKDQGNLGHPFGSTRGNTSTFVVNVPACFKKNMFQKLTDIAYSPF